MTGYLGLKNDCLKWTRAAAEVRAKGSLPYRSVIVLGSAPLIWTVQAHCYVLSGCGCQFAELKTLHSAAYFPQIWAKNGCDGEV